MKKLELSILCHCFDYIIQIPAMAATREKRSTAGNRMGRLLEAEDEDEFYKTTYGGFDEVCISRNLD